MSALPESVAMNDADKSKAGGEVRPVSRGRPRHDSDCWNGQTNALECSCEAHSVGLHQGGVLPEIWADNVQGGGENGSTRWGKRGDNWTAMGAEIGGQGGRRSGMPMRGIIAGLINGDARTTDRCSPGRCAAPFPLPLTPRPCDPSLAHFRPLATLRSLQAD